MTKDHVLFQTNQVVDFSLQRSFGQHLCRFLERGSRDEARTLDRSLRDTQQLSFVLRHSWFGKLRWRSAFGLDLQVCFLKQLFRNDLSFVEATGPRIGHANAIGHFIVDRLEIETVQNHSRQQVSITR